MPDLAIIVQSDPEVRSLYFFSYAPILDKLQLRTDRTGVVMSNPLPLYRVQFVSNGERYELYAKEVSQGGLFGFIEVGDFVWNTHSSVVVDPSHERLKSEFADVTSTYVPMHNVLRIDVVKKQGAAKISKLSDKVAAFPNPIYTPKKD